MGLKEKHRRGVFCVVYSRVKDKIEYLVLHRKLHWKGWEFCKGGLNPGEKILEGIKREVKEETGLKILKIKKHKFSGTYKYDKILNDRGNIGQTFSLYSVEVKKSKVKFDRKEHDNYKWFKFDKAVEILTWPNQRKSLGIVDKNIGKV